MIYVLLAIALGLIIAYLVSKKKVTSKNQEATKITNNQDSVKLTFNNKAGYIDGRHYTEYAEDIKELKRQNKFKEAESLLLKIIEVLKAEAKIEGPHWFIAPWYFEQLAIIYRKQGLIKKETEILEHFLKLNKMKGDGDTKLEVRYRKAKELLKKQNNL